MSDIPSPKQQSSVNNKRWLLIFALPMLLHATALFPAEPVFNGDANRHVMTSVFFRDFLSDVPLSQPRQYVEEYYEQYPALGLLIWPPLFHGVTGALMTVAGTSVLTARAVVFASFLLAAICLFRLVRRRLDAEQSVMITAVFSVMPMTFDYSRYVMLEMPTLGLCLLCLDQFDLWLSGQKTRPLYLAAFSAAMAALTRFDAIVLLPVLLLTLLFSGNLRRLRNIHVVLAATMAVVLIAPTYMLILKELGDFHVRQATESVKGTTTGMLPPGALYYYLIRIPLQAGWMATSCLVLGLLSVVRRTWWKQHSLFAALLTGTYATFTPLAELVSRHSIYWLPAVAYFSVTGVTQVAKFLGEHTPVVGRDRLRTIGTISLLLLTAIATLQTDRYRVVGYRQAANCVLQHSCKGDAILIDGWWDGNMTYHLRHLDPNRSRHVVRADRLIYSFTSVPNIDFQQFVESDREILEAIASVNPSCILVEDPQPFGHIPISERIRTIMATMPDVFNPIDVIDVDCEFLGSRPFVLRIYQVNSEKLQQTIRAIPDLMTTPDQIAAPSMAHGKQHPHRTVSTVFCKSVSKEPHVWMLKINITELHVQLVFGAQKSAEIPCNVESRPRGNIDDGYFG